MSPLRHARRAASRARSAEHHDHRSDAPAPQLLLGLGELQEIANALHRIARHEIQVRGGQAIGRRRLLQVVSVGLREVARRRAQFRRVSGARTYGVAALAARFARQRGAAMRRWRAKSMQNPPFRILLSLELSVAEAIGCGGRSIA
jgi:hypothetical protein